MRVIIRVDASFDIGSGHLMRCLTLADLLRQRKAIVSFVSRALPGNLCGLIRERNYRLFQLPYRKSLLSKKDNSNAYSRWLGVPWELDAGEAIEAAFKKERADLLVVDHYALAKPWELSFKPHVQRIMVIDDLANRKHYCDILLDQNYYHDMDARYDGLLPGHCRKFFGPRYALLRKEFFTVKKISKVRSGTVKRIFVFFGWVDKTNETGKAIEAIKLLGRPDICVDVIIGFSNPNKEKIIQACNNSANIKYYCAIENISRFMLKADLAIGAGGITTWERSFLGLPAIVIALAENQMETAQALMKQGAIWNLGLCSKVSKEDILYLLKKALAQPGLVRKMSEAAARLADEKSALSYRRALLGALTQKGRVGWKLF